MVMGEIVTVMIQRQYRDHTQELQQILIEQEWLKNQWHDYQCLITQENSFYTSFEQSMILKISTPHVIATLMKYLLEASQVHLIDIQVSLERQQPEYILYRIDLDVGGKCENEILDLIDRLNFPNIIAIDSVYLRRCAQLSLADIQQMKGQSADTLLLLVCGKISVFWLSWQGV
ncbi:MAG TPA: hypothetical protein VNJ29_00945 [Candidatus Nitrosotenuis sp.]|jgi:predicted transcriptional regulator|nr:hypothetical protein [Candidatus Nitrosotenuis sp.]